MRAFLRRYRLVLGIGLVALVIIGLYIFAEKVNTNASRESYPEQNYSQIEEGIFLGGIISKPPVGAQVVLNLCETEDPYKAEIHRWEPMHDLGPPPTLDWLKEQVEFIHQERQAGKNIYIHCRAGINRSVTVLAAYLMWRDGTTREEALNKIREKRPRANPYEVYKIYLGDWEAKLKKDKR